MKVKLRIFERMSDVTDIDGDRIIYWDVPTIIEMTTKNGTFVCYNKYYLSIPKNLKSKVDVYQYVSDVCLKKGYVGFIKIER